MADSTRAPSALLLQVWFAVLAFLALLAFGRASLLPPWPRALPLEAAAIQPRLAAAGLAPRALPPQPAARTEWFAISPRLVWRLSGGLQLQLAAVAGRRWPEFQVAQVTRGIPSLSLQQRRLDVPQAGAAAGRILGRPALQTCLVPQGNAPSQPAVTAAALGDAVGRQPSSAADRLRRAVSFQPPRRIACLLVTLTSPSTAPVPQQTWTQVVTVLKDSSVQLEQR
ncbi:MAG: hypothetical protein VKK97_08590 [Synechococcaceae cyanobacterium]|nr:hypothetical protein [Synechococcaceae cyanobacterium]